MAQWSSEAGWSVALEPERGEEPEVLAARPEPRRPGPVVVARRIHGALRAGALRPDISGE